MKPSENIADEAIGKYYAWRLNKNIVSFLERLGLAIHGLTTYERLLNDLSDPYIHVFYSSDKASGPGTDKGMALVGVEDTDPGSPDDGWTDVLLPIFWDMAPNQGMVYDRPLIFVDGAMSGLYNKELWLYTKGAWRRWVYYSIPEGFHLYYKGWGANQNVAYIEYDLNLDTVYYPTNFYDIAPVLP